MLTSCSAQQLCQCHFLPSGFPSLNANDPDYVPSVFAFSKRPEASEIERDGRLEQRRARQQQQAEERVRAEQQEAELELLELECAQSLLMMNVPSSVSTQTEATTTADCYQQTELETSSVSIQTEISNAISATTLKGNDSQTKFYMGLPKWAHVLQIFSLVSPYICHSHTRLTLPDELILVLVKPPLNLPFQDLAY